MNDTPPGLSARPYAAVDAHPLVQLLLSLPGYPWSDNAGSYQQARNWLNQARDMRRWTAVIDGHVVGHIAMENTGDGWQPSHLFTSIPYAQAVTDALTTAAVMGTR